MLLHEIKLPNESQKLKESKFYVTEHGKKKKKKTIKIAAITKSREISLIL